MAQYTYDEQGVTFNYFVLSVLALFLVPITLQWIYQTIKAAKEKAGKSYCNCEPCKTKSVRLAAARKRSAVRHVASAKIMFIVLGWILFAFLAHKISVTEVHKAVWDPYDILQIPEGTELSDIKKTYRKLSLVYHPDKAPKDQAEEFEAKFVEITKAYKVLTDDDTRKNYEEYGHPDGKQSYSMGIALPKWLIEGSNSYITLGFYGLLFGIFLPTHIARWWYRSRRLTKDRILNGTMALFFKELKENSTHRDLIDVLSTSVEFKEKLTVRPSDEANLVPIVSAVKEEMENRYGQKFEKSKRFSAPYCYKVKVLIYAHLLRIDVMDAGLIRDQQYIVETSVHLLNGLLQIALVKLWLQSASRIMDLSQSLVQAIYPGESALLQLPYVNNSLLRQYYRSKKRTFPSVQKFLDAPEDQRKSLLKPLSNDQYLDCMEVAKAIPQLHTLKAEFRVAGDNILTVGAIVTFVLKLQNGAVVGVESAKTNGKVDEHGEHVDEDDDEALDAVDAIIEGKKEIKESNERINAAHAPYFPGEKKPYWWVYLGDPKVNRIIVPPQKITDVVTKKTIKIQFPGPPKAGTYTFSYYVRSDSFVGTDIRQDIKLVIQEPSDLPPEDDIDDTISEPDEDSIAGQMKLMREQGISGAISGPPKPQQNQKGKAKADDDSSDSDSDSDDD
ncbi:Sec63 Brl domain-containing protein [Umbelopsis sp. PMI_123]|nr:Sec63 Brl domain-containing protein [Umbelopsis sp. PMI_123]